MYFPSKKDLLFFLIFWGIILFLVGVYFVGGEPSGFQLIAYDSLIGIIINVLLIGFLLWIWFGTGYLVEDGKIVIRSGPFKTTVPIGEIKKLSKTKNPFSAPALSINRMEILYGHYKVALISPDHEEKFVVMLLEENPRIELDEKLKNHIEL
ncbi:hypothetical protein FPQ10_05850 [Allobacillus sp. SKP2-8]|uniref:PH domain-containing protein n=1 Tax=unclassified Allobacillus TaxID=2628859 RepID=UPI001182A221|nr:PH domain-containing protein [Allobacillus sp. SKP2-8]TSJ67319.1 hypothetical protein FPQ10_05850 [Allobacillus sp. SKP2-8]